jgi:hypothetical protein
MMISYPLRDGIGHGGRARRMLTGLLTCGLCGAELRASSTPRQRSPYGPLPPNTSTLRFHQARYICPAFHHIAILATETEERICQLVERRTGRADRPAIYTAIQSIVVSAGRPGLTRYDPYRLGIEWQPAYRHPANFAPMPDKAQQEAAEAAYQRAQLEAAEGSIRLLADIEARHS